MDESKKTRNTLQRKRIEQYYSKLRKICHSDNTEKKENLAEEMARKSEEKGVLFLLKRLAEDTYPCKIQALRTLRKVEVPQEEILKILGSLLSADDDRIRTQASNILMNLIEGNLSLEYAEKLLGGAHEMKKCALRIYGQIWKSFPEQVIWSLENIALQEKDYIIVKNSISLLGEIGKQYPTEVVRIFSKILFTAEASRKEIIPSALNEFATDHPAQVLQFLTEIERSHEVSSQFIPEVLSRTVDEHPERTFGLLKDLAASDEKLVRYAVMRSLHHFKEMYPEETLEVLLELWMKTGHEKPTYVGEVCVTQDEIKSQFIEIAVYAPSKALSILKVLATCEDRLKKRNALDVTFSLASKAPGDVFSLLEIFLCDLNYEIKESIISFLSEKWNKFPKTIALLKRLAKEEVAYLQIEIEEIFSANKDNIDEAFLLLRNLENERSRILLDAIYRIASQLPKDEEKIPQELLVSGVAVIQKELTAYFDQNQIENWRGGLELLRNLCRDHEPSIRIIGLNILPRFLHKDLRVVLGILETLASDDVPSVRMKAFEHIVKLVENYPVESFRIIEKLHNIQNKDVRVEIAENLHHFRNNFATESFLLLKEYTEDKSADVKAQAAISISIFIDIFPEESLNTIAKLCEDNDYRVLHAAFDSLREFMEMNSEDVLAILERLYFKFVGPAIREKIAFFLGNFTEKHSKRVMGLLEELARDSIGSVRSSAFSSLDRISKYQSEKTIQTLSTLSIEINPEIRQRVVRSIGVLHKSNPSIDLGLLEPFLKDEDISVRAELAFTLGMMTNSNPKRATTMFRRMMFSMKYTMLREAIAEAMASYGEYCPYEAMKILYHLAKYSDGEVSRKTQNSLHALKHRLGSFNHIGQNCFRESFLSLNEIELLDLIENIVKKIGHEEGDSYSKEVVYRYALYRNLLKFSTIKKISLSEDLLANHVNSFELVDDLLEAAFLELKNIASLLGKQGFYEKRDDKIENLKDCLSSLDQAEYQLEREFSDFDNPDFFILRSILRAWKNIISIEFARLRGKAELRVFLESREVMRREHTIVRLRLLNEGISKAENIVAAIKSLPDYTIISSSERNLRILSPNEPDHVEFCIKVKELRPFVRVAFSFRFDDAEKEGKNFSFADQIALIEKEGKYVEISNPYVPGTPLRTPDMFYGRDDLLKNIETTLKIMDKTHVLILHGQRRTGKTSILYQLKIRLGSDFLPIVLDFQGIPPIPRTGSKNISQDLGTVGFFHWMAFEIWRELSERNIEISEPKQAEFTQNPAFHFRNIFLQKVQQKLGDHKLIFMMDEFECIDSRIREGKIDKDVLDFMRNLMQHHGRMDFIFSGTHQLEEMSADYWSILFNIGLYHKISFLERHEAVRLICDPVKEYMKYDRLAVEKILEMTAGHPYFIQLVCYYLINHQIKEKQNYATIEDVNDVLKEVVVAGTPHFQYIWNGLTRFERIMLLVMAKILSSQSALTESDIIKYLQQYHFETNEKRVRETLEGFLKKGVLDRKMIGHYRFKIELIRLWCEKNKELNELMEERK